MKVIYCCDPFTSFKTDEAYAGEAAASKILGADWALIDHDALTIERNIGKAVRQINTQPAETLYLYRGWMMTPNDYTLLYDALLLKGVRLINDPAAYRFCHYLPDSYAVIEPLTAKSVWMKVDDGFSVDNAMRLLETFSNKPIILKDFVKSQKHYWQEACFIPDASDRNAVSRVVERFLELQGSSLNEGLVFREFIDFEALTIHSKSGMPLSREYRIFFLDGKPVYWFNYWEEGVYSDEELPLHLFTDIAKKVSSRFFTMDVAKRLNGEWMIVELGDGQVAGLPDNLDPNDFYRALKASWPA